MMEIIFWFWAMLCPNPTHTIHSDCNLIHLHDGGYSTNGGNDGSGGSGGGTDTGGETGNLPPRNPPPPPPPPPPMP